MKKFLTAAASEEDLLKMDPTMKDFAGLADGDTAIYPPTLEREFLKETEAIAICLLDVGDYKKAAMLEEKCTEVRERASTMTQLYERATKALKLSKVLIHYLIIITCGLSYLFFIALPTVCDENVQSMPSILIVWRMGWLCREAGGAAVSWS